MQYLLLLLFATRVAAVDISAAEHNKNVLVGVHRSLVAHVLSKVEHLENEEAAAFRTNVISQHKHLVEHLGKESMDGRLGDSPPPTIFDLENHFREVHKRLKSYEPEAFLEIEDLPSEKASSSPLLSSIRFKGRSQVSKKQKGGHSIQRASTDEEQLTRTGGLNEGLAWIYDMIKKGVELISKIQQYVGDHIFLRISGGIGGHEGGKATFGYSWIQPFAKGTPDQQAENVEHAQDAVGKLAKEMVDEAKNAEVDNNIAKKKGLAQAETKTFLGNLFENANYLVRCGGVEISVAVMFKTMAAPPHLSVEVGVGFNFNAMTCIMKLQLGLPAENLLTHEQAQMGCQEGRPWLCVLTYPFRTLYTVLYPQNGDQTPTDKCLNSISLGIGIFETPFESFGYEASLNECGESPWEFIKGMAFKSKRQDPEPEKFEQMVPTPKDGGKDGEKSWINTLASPTAVQACTSVQFSGSIDITVAPLPGVAMGVVMGPASKILSCAYELLKYLGKAIAKAFLKLSQTFVTAGLEVTRAAIKGDANRARAAGVLMAGEVMTTVVGKPKQKTPQERKDNIVNGCPAFFGYEAHSAREGLTTMMDCTPECCEQYSVNSMVRIGTGLFEAKEVMQFKCISMYMHTNYVPKEYNKDKDKHEHKKAFKSMKDRLKEYTQAHNVYRDRGKTKQCTMTGNMFGTGYTCACNRNVQDPKVFE